MTISLDCQILGVNKPLFSDLPFFNTVFINKNSIKSITGSISSKKVKDIIRSQGLDYHYEFNRNGDLLMQLTSHYSKNVKDSTVIAYTYTPEKNISVKRISDSYGYFSYHYKYDQFNNIILQTYCRDENRLERKDRFELKKEYVIVEDSFSYQMFDSTQIKKIFYNSYGKKFKEQTKFYNTNGYLIEEYTKFIIGNKKKRITYEYDENGRLFKKNIYDNIAKGLKKTEVYLYDKIGNILDIKYYNAEKHISSKQFLYDNKTMLLSAMIEEDIASSFLQIIKYRYTFFDNKY